MADLPYKAHEHFVRPWRANPQSPQTGHLTMADQSHKPTNRSSDRGDQVPQSFSLLSNERNLFFYIINIKTNIVHLILTIAGLGPHHPSVTAPTIGAKDVILPHDHGWTELLQTVRPTLAIRPQHVLTPCCATGVARSMVPSASSLSIPMQTLTQTLNGQ